VRDCKINITDELEMVEMDDVKNNKIKIKNKK
jgi:hypothetical protein